MLVPAQQHGTIPNLAKDPVWLTLPTQLLFSLPRKFSEPRQKVEEASLESSCSDGQAASRLA